jgi:hypothetical protein
LAGEGVKEDSRPHEIRRQTQREHRQIHTKDDEEFSPEKVIQLRLSPESRQARAFNAAC